MTLQYRAAQLLDASSEEKSECNGIKTVRALAVPYSDDYNKIYDNLYERFAPGSLTPGADPMKLRLEHDTTIGKIMDYVETERGLEITATISDTSAGRDAAALLDDGVLTAVSIGFNADWDTDDVITRDDGSLYITHRNAELMEVSLVSFPAYKEATISDIRSRYQPKGNTMDTEKEISEVRATLGDLTREIDTLKNETPTPALSPLAAYRSAGDFMKAYATGVGNVRAFADDANVIADTDPRNGWFNKTLQLMEAKQPITSMFNHTYDLPAEGMSFDYPLIKTNTLQIGVHEKEGDKLPFGKMTFGHGNASVKTYGGYTTISREFIDRASSVYLETIHRAQAIQYATAIEKQTQATLTQEITEALTSTPISSTLTATALTVDEIINLGLDLIDYFDDEIFFPFTGFAVSADVFKYLATLKEDPKAFQFTGAPADKTGTLSIRSRAGELDAISIHRLPAAVGKGIMLGYSSQAIDVKESPNAPLRLSDQRDDTTLTNIFTVYGYAIHAPQKSGIVPVKFAQAS